MNAVLLPDRKIPANVIETSPMKQGRRFPFGPGGQDPLAGGGDEIQAQRTRKKSEGVEIGKAGIELIGMDPPPFLRHEIGIHELLDESDPHRKPEAGKEISHDSGFGQLVFADQGRRER